MRRADNDFQTASKTYISTKNPNLKIRLLGVAHIGEKSYYQRIQDILDRSDIVLFEGTVIGWKYSPDLRCRQAAYLEPLDGLSQLLGLENQRDSLKYDPLKSYDIDYSFEEVLESVGQSSDCEDHLQSLLALIVQRRPRMRIDKLLALDETEFKNAVSPRDLVPLTLVAKEKIAEINLAGPGILGTELKKKIIDVRDKKALQGIKSHLDKTGTATVIFGAMHMPGIEKGILEMGYVEESEEWLTVFRI